jgi:hypothetical protein
LTNNVLDSVLQQAWKIILGHKPIWPIFRHKNAIFGTIFWRNCLKVANLGFKANKMIDSFSSVRLQVAELAEDVQPAGAEKQHVESSDAKPGIDFMNLRFGQTLFGPKKRRTKSFWTNFQTQVLEKIPS